MKYSSKSTVKKRRLLVLLSVLLLGAASVSAYSLINSSATTPEQEEVSVEEDQAANLEKKEALIDDETEQNGDKPISNPNDRPEQGSPDIDIEAEQTSQDQVVVKTKVDNLSRGQCSLKVTNSGTEKTYKADLIYQEQFSTCAGYTIPVSDIGAGTWSIELTVASEGKEFKSNFIKLAVES